MSFRRPVPKLSVQICLDLVEHGIEYRHVLALCWPNAQPLLISMRLSISWVE